MAGVDDDALWGFRALCMRCESYDGEALFDDVLAPALPQAQALMAPLQPFRSLALSRPGTFDRGLLHEWFALSELHYMLVVPMALSAREYRHFFEAIGFELISRPAAFDPLLCEIVDVANWPKPNEGVRAGRMLSPGLRFGEMVFARCAVDVYGDACHGLVKGVADRSTLYFTGERPRRPTNHQSHGWGHNSRWSTDFPRSYRSGGMTFVNVDGRDDLALTASGADTLDDLDRADAASLLLHRCAVRTPESIDHYPYHWSMALPDDAVWPLDANRLVSVRDALP